jgi:tRNA(Ile)-lysidine synthase
MKAESSTDELVGRVRQALLDSRVAYPGAKIVTAVSGGPDSTALVHVLHALSQEVGFGIVVAHLDHKLRKESHEDAAFVRRLAEDLGLECFLQIADIQGLAVAKGISVEEAGRRARYAFLEEVRTTTAAHWIATAHHLDDAFETFFLRLFRGSSHQGLRGIEPVRGHIVRPFIELKREEILRYLEDRTIPYRIDPTNLSSDTDRNFIRNRLLPAVRERFPGFQQPLKRTLELVDQENRLLDSLASQISSQAVTTSVGSAILDVPLVLAAPEPLVGRVIVAALYQVSGAATRWGRVHVRIVLGILRSRNPSARAFLPGGILVRRQYDKLIIDGCGERPLKETPSVIVTKPGQVKFPGSDACIEFRVISGKEALPDDLDNRFAAYFDADRVDFPLVLRGFQPGDTMRPWGLNGTRKLKKIFIDARIPRDERGSWPLLLKNDEILWLVGLRRSQAAPILPGTPRVLEVRLVQGKEKYTVLLSGSDAPNG